MAAIPSAFVEAAANVLTKPRADPDGKIAEFNYAACRVAKAGEREPAAEQAAGRDRGGRRSGRRPCRLAK